MLKTRTHKVAVLVTFASFLILFIYAFSKGFFSFEFIQSHYLETERLYHSSPLWFEFAFTVILTGLTAVSLPGASLISFLAGALFGLVRGTVVVALATTLGATFAFLFARYVLHEAFQTKYGHRVRVFNAHIHRDGAYYLFALRLNPIVPFFLINVVMGLTPMSLWTYSWVSFIGMIPGTLLYVNAGTQLAKVSSPVEILSPGILISLFLLGIFPLLAKKIFGKTTK